MSGNCHGPCIICISLNPSTPPPKKHIQTQLPLPLASHVPLAAARGFIFHHAEPDYVMMTHWLDDSSPSTLPPGPTHQVRTGGRTRGRGKGQISIHCGMTPCMGSNRIASKPPTALFLPIRWAWARWCWTPRGRGCWRCRRKAVCALIGSLGRAVAAGGGFPLTSLPCLSSLKAHCRVRASGNSRRGSWTRGRILEQGPRER